MQKASIIQDEINALVEKIRLVITENVPQKADRSSECQRLHMLEALGAFEHTVNGLRDDDLAHKKSMPSKKRSQPGM